MEKSVNKQISLHVLKSQHVDVDRLKFWSAIFVYIEKPHLLNRRVCGSKWVWGSSLMIKNNLTSVIIDLLDTNYNANDIGLLISQFKLELSAYEELDLSSSLKELLEVSLNNKYQCILIQKVISKQSSADDVFQVIYLDFENDSTSIFSGKSSSSVLPGVDYCFQFKDCTLNLVQYNNNVTNCNLEKEASNVNYLREKIFPKILKWCSTTESSSSPGSLQLVDVCQYNDLYQQLKNKYAKHLMEIWCENTDPQKYIYEDLSIAAYILLIWKAERQSKDSKRKQSFIDLGCGNGLLVYILSSEGHLGTGVDLRKRKIWNLYPSSVSLQENIIEPNDKNLLPDYDWLIGNHSDELTPWIPVIAAKSSYTTSFLVIPCCPHDFENKYLRAQSNKSLYAEYLEYVKEISDTCGFNTLQDKLRIPSTKRTCFIGTDRIYNKNEHSMKMTLIDNFILEKCSRYSKNSSNYSNVKSDSSSWSNNFQHREKEQPVKNCTTIDNNLKQEIVSILTSYILRESFDIEVDVGNQKIKWNIGQPTGMGDMARQLSVDQLKNLKKEYGGLQTLLRNHSNIFNVKKGFVQLKVPKTVKDVKTSAENIRSKDCWFYLHHPQGCIWTPSDCAYSHEC